MLIKLIYISKIYLNQSTNSREKVEIKELKNVKAFIGN